MGNRSLGEAVSADQIKCLSDGNESDVQGHLLFFTLILSKGEDHVYC